MSDLISRQAAIDALNGEINITGRANAEAVRGYVRLVKDRLERLPSAQPERKMGEWILAEDGWYCSVCELYPPFDCDPEEKGIPYCPNCGAKMDEEKESDHE